MDCGALCVIVSGTQEMQRWCVNNCNIMGVSSISVCCRTFLGMSLFLPASYPLLTHDHSASSRFLLDGVQCLGNESRLSECDNIVIGIQGCTHNAGAAGVICTSK